MANKARVLKIGDRLLVADIGWVKTNIIVQEWMSETPDDFRVKEVKSYSGDFSEVLYPILKSFWGPFDNPEFVLEFLISIGYNIGYWEMYNQWKMYNQWEKIKCSFLHRITIGESFKIQVPSKLAAEWEEFDKEHAKSPRSSYDEVEVTHADIKAIFEPYVTEILDRIDYVNSIRANIKVILVVGGLGGSPYLPPLLPGIADFYINDLSVSLGP